MSRIFLVVVLAICLIPVACSSGSPKGPAASSSAPVSNSSASDSKSAVGEHKVRMQGFKFQPPVLTVNLGDTVEFANVDIVPHNAVAAGKFDSGRLPKGGTWKYVANEKGTFDYICTLHPNMKGRLIVQ